VAGRAGITLAWATGLGIVAWRSVTKQHRPPMPGQLLAVSGLFVLLAALAEYEPAVPLATTLAFGVDLAAFLQILPGTQAGGAPKQAAGQPQTGTKPTA
jgi:hypothetical protein